MARYIKFLLPLIIFAVMVGFLWKGLSLKPREVPSPLINKEAPAFKLSQLHDFQTSFSPEDMKGKVWLLNVWASWCVACRAEHPLLMEVARRAEVPLFGLNYKDAPKDAKQWLVQHGNPYKLSAVDFDGRVGIDYGVYGVPETFVIDKKGVIRHKVIGPVSRLSLAEDVMPLVKELEKE